MSDLCLGCGRIDRRVTHVCSGLIQGTNTAIDFTFTFAFPSLLMGKPKVKIAPSWLCYKHINAGQVSSDCWQCFLALPTLTE